MRSASSASKVSRANDEVVSLARLQRAMKIYARALLALNEMDW